MATQGMEDVSELSDEELDARQRAEDGEDPGTDPKVGEDDAAAAAQATADAAAAQAAADAQAAAAAQGAATTTTTDAAADKTAGAEAKVDTGKVEGVLSKDGGRVLPYTALQAERRSARAASARADRAERELEATKQQLEDFKAGKTPEKPITEADVVAMETEFPEDGKRMRAAFNRIQELEKLVPKATTQVEEPGDDPVQEAIDQVPLLLKWQHEDAQKFQLAQEIDATLMKSPKWVGKPAVERFTEVARRVANEYDIPFDEKPKPSATPAAAPAASAKPAEPVAERKPPESLSDFKGGSVAEHGTTDWARLSPQAQLARMADMSDDDIDAHLAKYGQ